LEHVHVDPADNGDLVLRVAVMGYTIENHPGGRHNESIAWLHVVAADDPRGDSAATRELDATPSATEGASRAEVVRDSSVPRTLIDSNKNHIRGRRLAATTASPSRLRTAR
jgi:hypothetical protein